MFEEVVRAPTQRVSLVSVFGSVGYEDITKGFGGHFFQNKCEYADEGLVSEVMKILPRALVHIIVRPGGRSPA